MSGSGIGALDLPCSFEGDAWHTYDAPGVTARDSSQQGDGRHLAKEKRICKGEKKGFAHDPKNGMVRINGKGGMLHIGSNTASLKRGAPS